MTSERSSSALKLRSAPRSWIWIINCVTSLGGFLFLFHQVLQEEDHTFGSQELNPETDKFLTRRFELFLEFFYCHGYDSYYYDTDLETIIRDTQHQC